MFEGENEKALDEAFASLVEWRDDLRKEAKVLDIVLAFRSSSKASIDHVLSRAKPLRKDVEVATGQKCVLICLESQLCFSHMHIATGNCGSSIGFIDQIQEMCNLVSMTVACGMAAECIIHANSYDGQRLSVARKVSGFMSQTLGMSPSDLPETLRKKFDIFSKGDSLPKESAKPLDFCLTSKCLFPLLKKLHFSLFLKLLFHVASDPYFHWDSHSWKFVKQKPKPSPRADAKHGDNGDGNGDGKKNRKPPRKSRELMEEPKAKAKRVRTKK